MFKNRHFQVKVVKDSSDTAAVDPTPTYLINPENISKEQIRYVACAVVTVLVARKLLNTTCEAALIMIAK